MRNSRSMEEKISLRLFFMGLVGLVLTAALCIIVFHKAFSEQIWQGLELTTRQIAAGYSAQQEISVFGDEALRLTLIGPDGSVLYDSAADTTDNHLSRPEIRQALETGEGRSERDSATMGYRTFYYAVRLADGSVLRVAQDSADIWSVFDKALPAIILCCILIMVLAVLLSWFLTRSLVRPILDMAEHLDDVEQHIPYRELAPVASAIHSDRLVRENNEKLRQEFTANVSHELKTPLTSISGYAELISAGIAKPGDIPMFADKIHTEAVRMLTLVNDILELSQLDGMNASGQRQPEFESIDLAQLAKSCTDSLRVNAQKAFVTLYLDACPATVRGDRAMLAELCQNLCDNAIRYNRPGGKVIVSTGLNPNGAPYLRVRDDGIGIPKEAQSRVFERFYRVDKSRSKATGGTGLGLAIVKHIAMIHNASLELESQLGDGTCITVTFAKE